MPLTKINSNGIESGTIVAANISNTVALGGPKISGLDYPGDDTAALPAGGQTITVNGDGFQSGCSIYVDGTVISVVSFLSETQLQFVAPVKATGLYAFYVVNPDGGTAILVPGMVYSGTPTWSTASGSLGTPYETNAFSVNLSATGDGSLTYAVTTGSSLPSGLSLSSGGTLSGTVPVTNSDTTYTFNLDVIDGENQSTTRQFSVTYRVDVVTWSSPAADASFSWAQNAANTTALSAVSAAGKSVSYAVQSGSLPAGVAVSGSNISGTPTTLQNSTSVVIRSTAADTARYSDRTLYFTIIVPPPSVIGESYGGGYYAGQISTTGNGVATHYLIVAPKATGETSSNQSGCVSFCDALTIGGYSDWYLPSKEELEIIYYNLKPSTDANDTNSGTNTKAVPSRGSNYTTSVPAQTAVAAFRTAGAEGFTNGGSPWYYWSSTTVPATSNAWKQYFGSGQQFADKASDPGYGRAIRAIPV